MLISAGGLTNHRELWGDADSPAESRERPPRVWGTKRKAWSHQSLAAPKRTAQNWCAEPQKVGAAAAGRHLTRGAVGLALGGREHLETEQWLVQDQGLLL